MGKLNIGLVGGGFIGRVHTIAFQAFKGFFAEKAKEVSLKLLAEKDENVAKKAASRLGIDEWVGDWHDLVKRKDIHLVIVAVPNYMHKEIVLEAINQGKHILCEKPLALNAKDAKQIYDAAYNAGIKHGINFNYRKTPGVLLIKRWIEEGFLGSILSFRGSFIQDWALDTNVPFDWHFQKRFAGSGVLGDLGSHVIDMGRFLVGEITEVAGSVTTHIKERPLLNTESLGIRFNDATKGGIKTGKVDVDDICDVLLRFENGVQGSMFASRVAQGRKNHFEFEIYGTQGSVLFDWERPNEVYIYSINMPKDQRGFCEIQIGEVEHPYGEAIWPIPGMGTGFAEPFSIQLFEIIDAIINDKSTSPNFYDGWKVNQVLDAIEEAIKNNNFKNLN